MGEETYCLASPDPAIPGTPYEREKDLRDRSGRFLMETIALDGEAVAAAMEALLAYRIARMIDSSTKEETKEKALKACWKAFFPGEDGG